MSPIERAIDVVGGSSLLARMVGVTQSAPSMWRARGVVPVERCAAIERATSGTVMRWDLRPHDWRDIWPELVARPDAPPVCDKKYPQELSALTTGSSTEPVVAEVQMSRRVA